MYRLGIIGTGIIAHEHIKAAIELDCVKITAVSNRTLEKALLFAERYGVNKADVFYDYTEMLDRKKLDAVIINLANHLHKEAFIECAKRNVSVLLEKPMATDSKSCEVILEYAARYKTKLMIGHTQRYNRNYVAAKEIIDSGELGRLIMIKDIIYYNYFWQGRPQWYLDEEKCGGGIMINYGVHTFDRIQFLSGARVKKVFAHIDWDMDNIKVDSSYQVMALLENDVSACMTCTGYSGPFTEFTDMIFKNGILRICLRSNNMDKEGVWVGNNEHDFHQICTKVENPYFLQLKDFIKYLDGKTDSPIDGEYGYAILKQVESSYSSNLRKEAVAVVYSCK